MLRANSIEPAGDPILKDARPAQGAGHARWVRASHWIVALSMLTLACSGCVILMAHPRLYWGAVGNDLTPPLFELPISRNYRHGGWEKSTAFFPDAAPVTASRTYDIFNQNSWGRSLHFLSAWIIALAGATYVTAGFVTGHLRRDLLPHAGELTPQSLWRDLMAHLRLHIRPARGGPPYGLLQKCTYSGVVLIALPVMMLTGLTMSPAITAAYPVLLDLFAGSQSARTIHFFLFALLMVFLFVHVLMVFKSGFKRQMRAMTVGS
jgi:thiosulfate reductase cytochrome b subunit